MSLINLVTSKGGSKIWRGRSSGRAMVEAVKFDAEEQAAHDGEAYIMHGECHTAAATSGALMYIKNTSATNSIHVTRIYIDVGTLTPTDMFLTQVINPTTVSNGTDITTTGVIQKATNKVNALKSSGATLKISDGSSDMTFTGGDQFHKYPVASRTSYQRSMNGTNVIGPGGEWIIGWESAGTATDAQVISLSVNLYLGEEDPE